MAGDQYWSNVVLAMHMDGADSGTTFTEQKGKTVTAYGGAQTKVAEKKFGISSAYFDGTADYLLSTNGITFATEDFTIEFWVYHQNNTNDGLFHNYITTQGLTNWGYWEGGGVTIYKSSKGAVSINLRGDSFGSVAALTSGVWNHVALVRSGAVVTCFINGAVSGSVTLSSPSTPINTAPLDTYIGGGGRAGLFGTASLLGYMDDVRITKGVARYSGDFTPPTSTFSDNGIQVSGTVKDAEGAFAERTVRAYRRSDGALSGSATSNATTGVFAVNALDSTEHYVICLPSSGAENALIFDNVTPI